MHGWWCWRLKWEDVSQKKQHLLYTPWQKRSPAVSHRCYKAASEHTLLALERHFRVHGGKVFRKNGSALCARGVAGFLVRVKCGADVQAHLISFCIEISWMFFGLFSSLMGRILMQTC